MTEQTDQNHIDITNRVDTWYVIFSPLVVDSRLNKWARATTDEECRHVFIVRKAGALGMMQIEATAFGCFCEYVPVSVPEFLLDRKAVGERVFEWGIQWTENAMKGHIQSETLNMKRRAGYSVSLEKLRASVYIQPGYFSCVALVKVFLNINDDHVLKPRELMEYLQTHGAQEV